MDAGDQSDETIVDLPKPAQLLALAPVCRRLFDYLKRWFEVADVVSLDLSAIDAHCAVQSMRDRQMIAALAMRKLQALHVIATPGIPTKADVALTLIDSALRALVEAPKSHLTRQLDDLDWDHAWKVFDSGMLLSPGSASHESDEFGLLVCQMLELRPVLVRLMKAGNRPLV